jgi:hypothetical protein
MSTPFLGAPPSYRIATALGCDCDAHQLVESEMEKCRVTGTPSANVFFKNNIQFQ